MIIIFKDDDLYKYCSYASYQDTSVKITFNADLGQCLLLYDCTSSASKVGLCFICPSPIVYYIGDIVEHEKLKINKNYGNNYIIITNEDSNENRFSIRVYLFHKGINRLTNVLSVSSVN